MEVIIAEDRLGSCLCKDLLLQGTMRSECPTDPSIVPASSIPVMEKGRKAGLSRESAFFPKHPWWTVLGLLGCKTRLVLGKSPAPACSQEHTLPVVFRKKEQDAGQPTGDLLPLPLKASGEFRQWHWHFFLPGGKKRETSRSSLGDENVLFYLKLLFIQQILF